MRGGGEACWRIEREVGYVVLDNPPMNVLTDALRGGILEAFEHFERDRVRAVVVTGAGERAFCGGADLREEAGLAPETVGDFQRRAEAVGDAIRAFAGPVIAAVNGWAMGGGLTLALWCDVRIGSTAARLGAVGVKVGLIASNVQLRRLLPEGRARDALLTGRTLDAGEAYRMGLLSAVVPPGRLLAEAGLWAARAAALDPDTVAATKRLINGALDVTLEEAEAQERRAVGEGAAAAAP
ncbi:MAG TPA: enoyl-CoA hydratase/isomerase family protein [Thermodesulfobacteriota bacterium]